MQNVEYSEIPQPYRPCNTTGKITEPVHRTAGHARVLKSSSFIAPCIDPCIELSRSRHIPSSLDLVSHSMHRWHGSGIQP